MQKKEVKVGFQIFYTNETALLKTSCFRLTGSHTLYRTYLCTRSRLFLPYFNDLLGHDIACIQLQNRRSLVKSTDECLTM